MRNDTRSVCRFMQNTKLAFTFTCYAECTIVHRVELKIMRRFVLTLFLIGLGLALAYLVLRPSAPPPTPPTPTVAPTASPTSINLQPYTGAGFTSLIPEQWYDAGDGTFAQRGTDSAITQRIISAPAIQFVASAMRDRFDFVRHAEGYNVQQVNGREWRIYNGATRQYRITYAITAERPFAIYLVMLQALPADYEQFQEQVFLPALRAFAPD